MSNNNANNPTATLDEILGLEKENKTTTKTEEIVSKQEVASDTKQEVLNKGNDLLGKYSELTKVDLDNEYSELPEGKYLVKIKEIKMEIVPTGKEVGTISYKVIDGDHTNQIANENFYFFKGDGTVNEMAVKMFIGRLATALGQNDKETRNAINQKTFIPALQKLNQKGVSHITGLNDVQGELTISKVEYTNKEGSKAISNRYKFYKAG